MLNITKPANTSRKGLSLDADNVVILEKRLFHSITLLINVAQKNQSGNSQKEIATGK